MNNIIIDDIFLGTYQLGSRKFSEQFLRNALTSGVRKFDTAPSYGTESVLGKVIDWGIRNRIVQRNQVVICDKIDGWQMQRYCNDIEGVIDHQLQLLKTPYIDIMLVHWPFIDYFENTWDVLQKLKGTKIKKIGICNVDKRIYENLLSIIHDKKPDVVQIERHPYNNCLDFCNYLVNEGIMLQAYSPVCRMKLDEKDLEKLEQIGKQYNKTAGQVILRWHIDTGVIPIIKTNKLSRIEENRKIFDFRLSEEDIATVNAMNKNYKLFPLSWGCPGI